VAKFLGIDLENLAELADVIVDDLDEVQKGIGWWSSYTDLGTKERILISDQLAGAARSSYQNVLEAYAERFEFNAAIEDFRYHIQRGVKGRSVVGPPPRGPADDFSPVRVTTHFCGALRGLASALDCLGGCLVGVAGLPTGIVKAALSSARDQLT
jgi:hypothetical protein